MKSDVSPQVATIVAAADDLIAQWIGHAHDQLDFYTLVTLRMALTDDPTDQVALFSLCGFLARIERK